MSDNRVRATFEVTASSEDVMARFVRLLAGLHLSSIWGYSRAFTISLDGGGPERLLVDVDEWPEMMDEVRGEFEKATSSGRDITVSKRGYFTTISPQMISRILRRGVK